jgi:PAS domain S-box-containing protein
MADSAPVLIWINGQGGCEFVNRTYLAFTGRTAGESLGMGWTVDLHPGDAKQYIESFQKAFEARIPFEAQFRFRRADGEYRWLKSIGLPRFTGRGGFLGYVGCSIDISDLKRSEEALRRSEEKSRQQAQELEQQLIASGRLVSLGEITASMAHEFNNPLGIIMGFAQDLLSETDPPSPNYRALKIINEETKRCEKIIRDLLEYSRPKTSEVRPTDVKQVVEKSLNLVETHLYQQKIKTTVQVESNLPKIYADPQEIEQVLVNLYLNAIDAMPEGGRLIVRASLNSVSTADGPSRQVRIAVADTGFGIEPEDLRKIFQPFFTAKKTRGLGLGLPVCERIIRNHGGRIEAESVPGRGATFKIYLPVDRSQPAENQPSKI